jgi:hypothetical protein
MRKILLLAGLLVFMFLVEYEGPSDVHRLKQGRRVIIASSHMIDPSGGPVPPGTQALVVADDGDDDGLSASRREVVVTIGQGLRLTAHRDDLRPLLWSW